MIRKLPARASAAGTGSLLVDAPEPPGLSWDNGGPESARAVAPSYPPVPATPATPSARRSVVSALAPDRYKVVFTASAEVRAKLREAQALLRHQIPDGDLEQIVDRALDALLAQLRKQRLAVTVRPQEPRRRASGDPPNALPGSRHIPAAVRRAVWARDGGRCAFVSSTGYRCDEEAFLEFHHVVPYSHGGPATADNIELRCRTHNGHEAERRFGRWSAAVREPFAIYAAATPAVGSVRWPGGQPTRPGTSSEVEYGMACRGERKSASLSGDGLKRRRRGRKPASQPVIAGGASARARPAR